MNKFIFVIFLSSVLFVMPREIWAQKMNLDSLESLVFETNGQEKLFLLNLLGTSLRENSPDLALQYSLKAEKLARVFKNYGAEAKAKENIGWIYYRKGEWQNTFDYSKDAYELASLAGDLETAGHALINLGALYHEQRNYDHSIKQFKKAFLIGEQLNDVTIQVRSFSNIAYNFSQTGELDSALYYAKESIQINEENHSPYLFSFANRVIGDVYSQRKQLDSAQIIFEESLVVAQKNDLKSFEASLIHRLGSTYKQKGEFDKAKLILLRGLSIAQKNGFLDELSKIHKELSQVYVELGEIEKAFQHQTQHLVLFDSLVRKSQQDRITVLQKSFEENMVNAELQFLKFQFESQASRLSLARNLNILISLAILLIIGLVIWLYELIKRIRKTNLSLTSQKEIIFNQNLDVMDKSKQLEEINQTKNKLFSILGHDLRGPIGQVKTIVDMVLDGDLSRNEFDELLQKLKKDLDSVYLTLNNTLSWSFSQMEGFRINQVEFNLTELVGSTIQLLSPQFKEKSIQVENLMPENVVIFADPDLLVVVIRNILNNAGKFSEVGELVKINSEQKDGFVYWSVIDFGKGMDQDLINSILAEDYVIHRPQRGTIQEKGSGLGLQVCKEFARLNGGELTIQSALNFGTVVCIKIPASRSNEVQATRKCESIKS